MQQAAVDNPEPLSKEHPEDKMPEEMVKELKQAEVREYEGEKLDSITAFRENSIRGVKAVDIENYRLEIEGLVDAPQSYTYDEVLAFQHYDKVVELFCVEGWSADVLWTGVLLTDLIDAAGVQDEANTIIFHAEDEYTSALPLDFVRDNDILLAFKINGMTLPPQNGYPFQVVAQDKYGYKWVRWVTKIELSDEKDYKGTWESRGWSNTADVGGPMFAR